MDRQDVERRLRLTEEALGLICRAAGLLGQVVVWRADGEEITFGRAAYDGACEARADVALLVEDLNDLRQRNDDDGKGQG